MRDQDLRAILRDAERLAGAAAQLLQSAAPEEDASATMAAKARVANILDASRAYARQHPWRTLWAATALGFLVGSILTHRAQHDRTTP